MFDTQNSDGQPNQGSKTTPSSSSNNPGTSATEIFTRSTQDTTAAQQLVEEKFGETAIADLTSLASVKRINDELSYKNLETVDQVLELAIELEKLIRAGGRDGVQSGQTVFVPLYQKDQWVRLTTDNNPRSESVFKNEQQNAFFNSDIVSWFCGLGTALYQTVGRSDLNIGDPDPTQNRILKQWGGESRDLIAESELRKYWPQFINYVQLIISVLRTQKEALSAQPPAGFQTQADFEKALLENLPPYLSSNLPGFENIENQSSLVSQLSQRISQLLVRDNYLQTYFFEAEIVANMVERRLAVVLLNTSFFRNDILESDYFKTLRSLLADAFLRQHQETLVEEFVKSTTQPAGPTGYEADAPADTTDIEGGTKDEPPETDEEVTWIANQRLRELIEQYLNNESPALARKITKLFSFYPNLDTIARSSTPLTDQAQAIIANISQNVVELLESESAEQLHKSLQSEEVVGELVSLNLHSDQGYNSKILESTWFAAYLNSTYVFEFINKHQEALELIAKPVIDQFQDQVLINQPQNTEVSPDAVGFNEFRNLVRADISTNWQAIARSAFEITIGSNTLAQFESLASDPLSQANLIQTHLLQDARFALTSFSNGLDKFLDFVLEENISTLASQELIYPGPDGKPYFSKYSRSLLMIDWYLNARNNVLPQFLANDQGQKWRSKYILPVLEQAGITSGEEQPRVEQPDMREPESAVVPGVSLGTLPRGDVGVEAREKQLGLDSETRQNIQYETAWISNRLQFELFTSQGLDTSSVDPELIRDLQNETIHLLSSYDQKELARLFASPSRREKAIQEIYARLKQSPNFYSKINQQYQKAGLSGIKANELGVESPTSILAKKIKELTNQDNPALQKNIENTLDSLILNYGLNDLQSTEKKKARDAVWFVNELSAEKFALIFFPNLFAPSATEAQIKNQVQSLIGNNLHRIKKVFVGFLKTRATELALVANDNNIARGIENIQEESAQEFQGSISQFTNQLARGSLLDTRELVKEVGAETVATSFVDSPDSELKQKLETIDKIFIPLWNSLTKEQQEQIYLSVYRIDKVPSSLASQTKLPYMREVVWLTSEQLDELQQIGTFQISKEQYQEINSFNDGLEATDTLGPILTESYIQESDIPSDADEPTLDPNQLSFSELTNLEEDFADQGSAPKSRLGSMWNSTFGRFSKRDRKSAKKRALKIAKNKVASGMGKAVGGLSKLASKATIWLEIARIAASKILTKKNINRIKNFLGGLGLGALMLLKRLFASPLHLFLGTSFGLGGSVLGGTLGLALGPFGSAGGAVGGFFGGMQAGLSLADSLTLNLPGWAGGTAGATATGTTSSLGAGGNALGGQAGIIPSSSSAIAAGGATTTPISLASVFSSAVVSTTIVAPLFGLALVISSTIYTLFIIHSSFLVPLPQGGPGGVGSFLDGFEGCWPTTGRLVVFRNYLFGSLAGTSHRTWSGSLKGFPGPGSAIDISTGPTSFPPIYTPFSGEATFYPHGQGLARDYGNHVVVETPNFVLIFAHMLDFRLSSEAGGEEITTIVTRQVLAGQQIGHVGSTGFSSGNHLHYEVLGVDILDILPLSASERAAASQQELNLVYTNRQNKTYRQVSSSDCAIPPDQDSPGYIAIGPKSNDNLLISSVTEIAQGTQTTCSWRETHNLDAAINANFFNDNGTPIGLAGWQGVNYYGNADGRSLDLILQMMSLVITNNGEVRMERPAPSFANSPIFPIPAIDYFGAVTGLYSETSTNSLRAKRTAIGIGVHNGQCGSDYVGEETVFLITLPNASFVEVENRLIQCGAIEFSHLDGGGSTSFCTSDITSPASGARRVPVSIGLRSAEVTILP